jgi:hypothetical protein
MNSPHFTVKPMKSRSMSTIPPKVEDPVDTQIPEEEAPLPAVEGEHPAGDEHLLEIVNTLSEDEKSQLLMILQEQLKENSVDDEESIIDTDKMSADMGVSPEEEV